MADFKVIETQEDFDAAIQKRLAQKEREVKAQFEGWMSPEDVATLKASYQKTIDDTKEKLDAHDKTVADLTERATKAETKNLRMEVAAAKGIPIELAARLQGSTKEALEKDAEALAPYLTPKTAPPMHSADPGQLLSGLRNADPAKAASDQALIGLLGQLSPGN
ncbi:MAG: DUF4355 domain-containing protein [Mogibacterium sp.]|nr:DUF4355 domain-containing protein [Mogibacterium sp.]MBR4090414.1 DUF4355 domain-containing protein [Mogibacterium sp.]